MATIDEVFESMSASDATDFEYLIIDPESRTISVPESEMIFGVQQDEKAERKYFLSPRFVASGLDLAGCFIRVNYRNANGEIDGYLVNDVSYTDDTIAFSWELSEKVTAYQGDIQFSVNADNGKREWNTTPATGKSLVGLSIDESKIENETSDVVTQLRAMVETQTTAVEAEGATQVSNVRETAVDATEEARTQIDAKAEATLATIPEDYTTIANKTNEFANALKGSVSGTAVHADDVSPVEHHPKVTVRSKNLFNTELIRVATESKDGVYISAVGKGTITITSPEAYVGNGFRGTDMTLEELCPGIIPGKRYVLSAISPSNVQAIFLVGKSTVWQFGTSKVLTEELIKCSVVFYGYDSTIHGPGDCVISNIQLEEDDTQTEYTPYVAPESVTLTRCGKNLIVYPFDSLTKQYNGITFTDHGDGTFTVNGTATSECVHFLMDNVSVPLKGKYTFSGISGGSITSYYIQPVIDGVYKDPMGDPTTVEFDGNLTRLGFYIKTGTTMDNVTFKLQLEAGDTPTEYEPYVGETYTPLEDGTVPSVTSAAPTMSLLTDNPNVIIDCEYNKDTNTVIQKLVDAITALGGTV